MTADTRGTVVPAHWVLATRLGELTVIHEGGVLTGLYFPRHWPRPDRAGFGVRADRGSENVAQQLHEYLGCKPRPSVRRPWEQASSRARWAAGTVRPHRPGLRYRLLYPPSMTRDHHEPWPVTVAALRSDDADRAGRVAQYGAGNRAKGHAADSASAARAYNEHLRLGSGVQQRLPRRAVRDLPQHSDAGVILLPAGHQAGEFLFHLARAAQALRGVRERANGH